MSKLQCNGKIQTQQTLFTNAQAHNANALAPRQIFQFGGRYGFVLIGPDISMPGGITINPPSVGGAFWDTLVQNGPPVTFNSDTNQFWKRGHLVNGEWGGPGNDWLNLTPLTAVANPNHATVEQYMRAFCQASLTYDNSNGVYKPDWYGIAYMVQCSQDPWSDPTQTNNTNLYSYAPEFIKVSWRAVRIPKPTNLQANQIAGYLASIAVLNNVPTLPFTPPARPGAISGACVPVGNTPGGQVFAGYGNFPAPQYNNQFDGEIEIHQS